ncbi:hypothetical protein FACS1894206_05810 [Deltaproteobacteria bacterium]|nr:hypothetical protein FACS1894206_05810 [Deltaproteobacteria bacterium]
MKAENIRDSWIKIRVTKTERIAIVLKAKLQGLTIADFIRQRALDYRLRQTLVEKERIRQLARIGVNLNQLAHWANTYKSRAEALEVISILASLEQEIHALPKSMREDDECI